MCLASQCLAVQARQLIHETLLSFEAILLGCYQGPDMALMLRRATAQGLLFNSLSHTHIPWTNEVWRLIVESNSSEHDTV